MDYAELRRMSLKLFLGFLGITALIAIVSVLAGEFGEIQGKILVTTVTISVASIFSMSCAGFIEKRKLPQPGICGIVLSICAALLLLAGIWSEVGSEAYWKATITFGVLAFAFAHALLLSLPELDDRQHWIQTVSSVCIGLLALLIVIAVWADIEREEYYRIPAAVAIIVGLETLAIPLLLRMRKTDRQSNGTLILQRVRDSVYKSADGRTYQVRETDTGHDTAQDRDPLPSTPRR